MNKKIKAGWSPYQIEGRLKLENEGICLISHESIYHYIYSDPKAGSPYQKGSVENDNGLVRVELPRTYPVEDLKRMSHKDE